MIKVIIDFKDYDEAFATAETLKNYAEELEENYSIDVEEQLQHVVKLYDQIEGQAQIMEDEEEWEDSMTT